MKKEVYVQVGVTAMRAPDGAFLPAVPLYIKAAADEVAADGHYVGSKPALQDVATIFADKFKQFKRKERLHDEQKPAR